MNYRNTRNGAIVSVREGKEMNPQVWELVGDDVTVAATVIVEAPEEAEPTEVVADAPAAEATASPSYNELKAKADELGISYKGNISKAALAEAIVNVQAAAE